MIWQSGTFGSIFFYSWTIYKWPEKYMKAIFNWKVRLTQKNYWYIYWEFSSNIGHCIFVSKRKLIILYVNLVKILCGLMKLDFFSGQDRINFFKVVNWKPIHVELIWFDSVGGMLCIDYFKIVDSSCTSRQTFSIRIH